MAALGLLRLPDALARQHAATKAATLALGVMIVGLVLLQPGVAWLVRGGLLALTVPVASHALARAAALRG